ncbi:hypothetical protein H2200_002494 [Cladophialophora chaetospira]|uniref:Xylanolytic transcriptional activator regulatory domain-containing protein n=1 Tax=Cladophialophora chaetospira TaxID=386627 RepID=A0AA38XJS9_9EURO|nr:hypothetical protein H2200_002494 [Cladophialophora chaetospira]
MAGWGDDHSATTQVDNQTTRKEILEYHDGVNSTTILGELFGNHNPQRFVRISLRDSARAEQGQAEDVEIANMDFLRRRGAFDLPTQAICEKLLQLYFEHVHPYIPVLDRMKFLKGFADGTYSTFLLQCILTSVMPYVPYDLLSMMELPSRSSAQRFFFTKAQLLYDLEVEKSQLCLLQGSMVLTASTFAFVVDKDCRFWLINAVRLATQMGLHRKQIADQLDGPTRKLFKRVFWVLYNRDVLMAIAGRTNVRRLIDHHCDVPEMTEDDWESEDDLGRLKRFISPRSRLQKLYLVQNTKLSRICARFIELFRLPDPTSAKAAGGELEKAIHQWRKELPADLYVEMVENWSHDAVWILVLRAMSYRLECVLYRSLRNLYGAEEESSKHHALQKQQNAMLELSTVLDRIMLQDLVGCCPLSITTAAATVVSMHIEDALRISSPSPKKQASLTHIHRGMAYLRAASEHWESVRGALRMLEEIVDKTGLKLGGVDHRKFDLTSMSPFAPKQSNPSAGRTASGGMPAVNASDTLTDYQSLSRDPGHAWTPSRSHHNVANMDLTYETMMGDEDPERWLNDLLAENVLGMDITQPWGELIDSSLPLA